MSAQPIPRPTLLDPPHPEAFGSGALVYLRQLLTETVHLRDLYVTQRSQTSSQDTQLLFDKHFAGQHLLVNQMAEDIRKLGGGILGDEDLARESLIFGMSNSVSNLTVIPRLLRAHEIVLVVARAMMHAARLGLQTARGINISCVITTNESHVCSLFLHMSREYERANCPPTSGAVAMPAGAASKQNVAS